MAAVFIGLFGAGLFGEGAGGLVIGRRKIVQNRGI